MSETRHTPVLYEECIEGLAIKPDGVYLDMTLGGFGHGYGICERLSARGVYIGLDMDAEAVARGREKSAPLKNKLIFAHRNFSEFDCVLDEYGVGGVDGCLIDLGVSSFQFDTAARGFSFSKDGPLDMRMDPSQPFSAADVVNGYSEEALKEILYRYGEERFAPLIARSIVRYRPITSTLALAEAVRAGIPKKFQHKGRHPATQAFQAIRIEVNDELSHLSDTLNRAVGRLNEDGRICVISFHSLEDRIVKSAFAQMSRGCICPKELPVCVCGNTPQIKLITRSPITPSAEEIAENVRSRSAKLRIAQKL